MTYAVGISFALYGICLHCACACCAQEKRRSRELEQSKRFSKDMETITESVYITDGGDGDVTAGCTIAESPSSTSPQHVRVVTGGCLHQNM